MDVALATSLLYYATIPDAYDLAVVVIGDRDYIPATARRGAWANALPSPASGGVVPRV